MNCTFFRVLPLITDFSLPSVTLPDRDQRSGVLLPPLSLIIENIYDS